MKILLNGEQKKTKADLTVEVLLKDLNLDPRLVAVEINENIIRKKDFRVIRLSENDRVEIIHLVGGGQNIWVQNH